METDELREFCALDEDCKKVMEGVFTRMNLSARAYDRILRVARTLCDPRRGFTGNHGRGRHDRRQDKKAAHSRSRSNASARPKIFQIKEKG